MPQNTQPGTCRGGGDYGDYYCDANAVCGVRCAEIDLLEANTHALHTTAHTADDAGGVLLGDDFNWRAVRTPTIAPPDRVSPRF